MNESVDTIKAETLPVVAVAELETAEIAPVVARANSLVIATPEDYSEAAEELKKNKGMQKRIDAKLIDPWRKSKANAAANMKEWDDLLMVPLRKAEDILKQKQLAYQAEQEAIRQAEQRRLQAAADEAARKEREKSEAAARLQREKEQAALQAAEEARKRAAAATNEAERAKAAAEAEKAQAAANKAAAAALVREETAAAVIAPVVTVAAVTPVIAGQSVRKTWKARVVNAAILPREYTLPNQQALDAFAKATKGAIPLSGVEFYEESTLASSSR